MMPTAGEALKLNIGSGQRPFGAGWTNIDAQAKWCPDIVADARHIPLPDESANCIVLHHVLEHFELTAADDLIRECYRLLQPGGTVIITVPDLDRLCRAWIAGKINDYIFGVNLYGAYMGDEHDIHRWGYSRESLTKKLLHAAKWSMIRPFNFRKIPGADIAQDWWVLGIEVIK